MPFRSEGIIGREFPQYDIATRGGRAVDSSFYKGKREITIRLADKYDQQSTKSFCGNCEAAYHCTGPQYRRGSGVTATIYFEPTFEAARLLSEEAPCRVPLDRMI